MKTRSSSGVGSKVDLAFNNKSLRITDLEEDDESAINATSKNIYEQLKKKSVVRSREKLDTNSGEITQIVKQTDRSDPLSAAIGLRSFVKKL
jgi:hypothetical protein